MIILLLSLLKLASNLHYYVFECDNSDTNAGFVR